MRRQKVIGHAHVAQGKRDRIAKAHALVHPFALIHPKIRHRVLPLFDTVLDPGQGCHAGRGVFVHLHGSVQAPGLVVRHAPANPPHRLGRIGHRLRAGVQLYGVT